jgi:hypothetical protein
MGVIRIEPEDPVKQTTLQLTPEVEFILSCAGLLQDVAA